MVRVPIGGGGLRRVLRGGLVIELIYYFWTDSWLVGVALSVMYRRLFNLFDNKLSSVAVMSELGWEEVLRIRNFVNGLKCTNNGK
jgi:hypothetical protein